jgi:hypothetical protein
LVRRFGLPPVVLGSPGLAQLAPFGANGKGVSERETWTSSPNPQDYSPDMIWNIYVPFADHTEAGCLKLRAPPGEWRGEVVRCPRLVQTGPVNTRTWPARFRSY